MPDKNSECHSACTPLVAAIRSADNDAVTELLQSGADTEEFIPLDAESRRLVRMQGSMMSTDDIVQTEQYVGQPFGGLSNFERTPLLEACRHDNPEAIRALIAAGAKLNAKDALGETVLSLCLYRGKPAVESLMDECVAQGKKFPVDDLLLGELSNDSPLYQKAVRHGRLSAKAKHFHFCMSCALLDIDAVTAQLDDGYNLNAKRPFELDPLREAACSELLRAFGHPQRHELAAGGIRAYETAPDKLLAGDNLNPELQDEAQVQTRIAMLELLVDRGLDVARGNPRDPFPLLGDVICGNAPAVLDKVVEIGVRFDPAELHDDASIQIAIQWGCFDMVEPLAAMGCPHPSVEDHWRKGYDCYVAWCRDQGIAPYDADAAIPATERPGVTVRFEPGCKAIRRSPWTWQLLGESQLMAALVRDGSDTTVRLTYSNVYGPIDGIELRIRPEGGEDWIATDLVEEIVDQDGDVLLRSMVDEIIGETPWDGTFETTIDGPFAPQRIEISVRSPAEGIETPMVIDDWLVEPQS